MSDFIIFFLAISRSLSGSVEISMFYSTYYSTYVPSFILIIIILVFSCIIVINIILNLFKDTISSLLFCLHKVLAGMENDTNTCVCERILQLTVALPCCQIRKKIQN